MQTKLTTNKIRPNNNISFPIGTILTVKQYYEKLKLIDVFGKHKKKGRDINSLIQSLTSYKLTENFSISKASDWINRKEILQEFNLKKFHEKTLFRLLTILGKNKEKIIDKIEDNLFEIYDFEHTDAVLDWTSLVIHGEMCKIAKHGYSRDHRPDKKQITLGLSQLAQPINVPIGITVNPGNYNDSKHFDDTFNQIKDKLKKGSLVTFDKGVNSEDNIKKVLAENMDYLTAKKLNKSDDKRIQEFDKEKYECIDAERRIYGEKFEKPSKIDYFYFSEELKKNQVEAKKRKAKRKLEEAKEIQKSLNNKKELPKKFKINNPLVDVKYSYQTKLTELPEKEALEFLESKFINGREGFFCLISSKNLTLEEALLTYRRKDSIEKTIHSLKNEIEIKPVRVWTDESIYGAIIIGFLAQLFISLMKYENEELKQTSTKFIKKSIMNLTVTVEYCKNRTKRCIYANFDVINRIILMKIQADT